MDRLTYKINGKYMNTVAEQAPPYAIDCDIDTAITKLAEYEDFEEQGKLLKPPVVVGDMTYNASKLFGRVVDAIVERIEIDADGFWVITSSGTHSFDDFGKSIFLTHEAVEAALKEMSE